MGLGGELCSGEVYWIFGMAMRWVSLPKVQHAQCESIRGQTDFFQPQAYLQKSPCHSRIVSL
jgi:hypothetical protein